MLTFPKNAFPAHIDDFLRSIVSDVSGTLRLPGALDNDGAFGGAPLAVQALASWARTRQSRVVELQLDTASAALTVDEFAASLVGMSAIYFSDALIAGEKRWTRFEGLGAVKPYVIAMNSGDFKSASDKREAGLVCFSGARAEYLSPLYSRPELGFVRESTDFRILLRRLLKGLDESLPAQLTHGQHELLSAMLHQLFQNTDEHGALDGSGHRYARATRGVFVRLTTLHDVHALTPIVGADVALKAYLSKATVMPTPSEARGTNSLKPRKSARPGQSVRLLELSVFDTGPGMALKWLAKHANAMSYDDFSYDEEYDAVKACFAKHATTKMVQNSGIGLPMALMAMKRLNAFMSLRTGRLSLYQDFSAASTDTFEPKLRAPSKNALTPEIAGTSYTIVFKVT